MRRFGWTLIGTLAASALFAGTPLAQQRPSISIGLPGIPPLFVSVHLLVAEQEKLFDKYGVNVTLRPFDTSVAAAGAVTAGDLDLSLLPTALVANMVSNDKIDLVAIFGYEKPTWTLVSSDANARCEDLKGQPVAVDRPGGTRSIALNQLLRACNLKAEDTQQVGMSSNGAAALAAGQIKNAVLHLDEVPGVERELRRRVKLVLTLADVNPVSHYTTLTTMRRKIGKQREAYVAVLAGLIETSEFIANPANVDKVAKAAEPTGRKPEDAKRAIVEYVRIDFWPKSSHGLSQKNIETIVDVQTRAGGIRPESKPVTYERFVDTSIYDDAVKLVRTKKGS